MMSYPEQFAKCRTIEDVNDLSKKMQRDRSVAAEERRKRIYTIMHAPFHDEANRWRKGDKVYFGKSDSLSRMSFADLIGMHKVYNIKAGQWCRVWHYQPRKRIAWLCQPGKPCEYDNIINHGFTLADLYNGEVSRTEIDLRNRSK